MKFYNSLISDRIEITSLLKEIEFGQKKWRAAYP
jgi:hypothetical protein